MKKVVLAVDDHQENLAMISNALNQEYKIVAATSAKKALEYLEREPVDLVLLDILMPEMNGFELCKILKSDDKYYDIPVVFVTSVGAVEDVVQGYSVGGVDYITKPYRLEEMKARIKLHIQMKEQKDELLRLIQELKESQNMNIEQARIGASMELLKNIAHHWRQPMTAISVGLDSIVAIHEDNDLDWKLFLEISASIKKSIQKMSKEIDQFVELFRHNDEAIPFYLKGCVQKSIGFMDGYADIIWEIDIDENLMAVGSSDKLMSVLLMIFANSLETFGERNIANPKITISSIQHEDVINLSIKDNGGGISQEILSTIFEPYKSSKFPKFGIGLSLFHSKIIIEKHLKGRLEARNSEDGAEFIISLHDRV